MFSVVNQFYTAEILKEYVIRGNTAILKCNIPSFVADYVSVEGWVVDDTLELAHTKDDYGKLISFSFPVSHADFFFCLSDSCFSVLRD